MQPILSSVPITAADITVNSKQDNDKEAAFTVFRHLLALLMFLTLPLLFIPMDDLHASMEIMVSKVYCTNQIKVSHFIYLFVRKFTLSYVAIKRFTFAIATIKLYYYL